MKKKKARYQHIKGMALFGAGLIFTMFIIFSTIGRQEFNTPHKFALELVGSIQSSVTKTTTFFTDLWNDYIALWDVLEDNRALREELQKAKALANEYREAAATNMRLTKILKLNESLPPPTLTAQIIGKDPSLWFKTIIINRGSSDGVQKGMPVITVEGVVGQIMDASPHYSKVLLAIDPNSAIDVLLQKARGQGIIKGDGKGYQLHYVLKNYDVLEGEHVISSGLGGVFPKGLQVGTVTKVIKSRRGMFQEIQIKPAVNFSRLEYLIIIMKKSSLAEK